MLRDLTIKDMSDPQCCENPPTISKLPCGEGIVEDFAGLQTYITGLQHSKLAIILASDAFGYEAPNLRKLADKVAAAGYLVVVPDFLYGDPVDLDNPEFNIASWRQAHNPNEKGYEDAKKVAAALKNRGVLSIGAVGFCWGGMVLAKLARSDYIQAAVILHPGPISADDIRDVDIPIAILGAEVDNYFPAEELKKLEDILSAKSEIDSFVKIFPGTKHGWSIRYKTDDEEAATLAEEAHKDMLNWLATYIK